MVNRYKTEGIGLQRLVDDIKSSMGHFLSTRRVAMVPECTMRAVTLVE